MPVSADLAWQKLTTIGIGSGTPVMAEPSDDIELSTLLKLCHQKNIPHFILGNGSNVVGTDAEFNGVVIRLRHGSFVHISPGRSHITVGSGVKLNSLIRFAAEHGWGGMAGLAGIPGSVGGAIRMNAGANGTTVGDMILEVFGFDDSGEPWAVSYEDINWQYRGSDIPENAVITGAIFKLEKVDATEEEEAITSEIERRRLVEPRGRNAGCVFKNPSNSTHAGMLIDLAGCKGLNLGGVGVSEEHANYIVNQNQASEADFIGLAKDVVSKVYDKSGIILKPEVEFVNPEVKEQFMHGAKPVKVTVLKGGDSSEREVSLESGAAVANALRNVGYDVTEIDIKKLEVINEMREADIVFPVLHGGFGEGGDLQELMEKEKIRFVGCSSQACRDTIDKIKSKEIMDKSGLPNPPWAVLNSADASLPEGMEFPVICKAPSEGSTVGIELVHNQDEWHDALKRCLELDKTVLVEKYIKGREMTVGIVDGAAMTPVEIVYPGEMYDYDAKYTHALGETFYYCPPKNISEAEQEKAKKLALEFNRVVNARDMIRIDFIVTEDHMYILEGNTIPGFTASSLLPKSAGQEGMSFEMLCAKLVSTALKRR